MSPSTQNHLSLGLVVQIIVMGTALAQAPPPDLAALVKQCEAAQTPEQCRSAVPVCEQALKVAEQTSPSTDLDNVLLKLWGKLGWCQNALGQYTAAEKAFSNSLSLSRSMYGPQHPEVATSLNNLAFVLSRQGQYVAAEALYRETLAVNQKLLGKEHPAIAKSLNNLANVFFKQGRLAAAEAGFREALTIRQKLLGKEHLDVAESLNNLAVVLARQGQFSAAEALHREALTMHQKLLGKEHPLVAKSLSNLARVLENQGELEAAEVRYREALELNRKLLGKEHLDIAVSLDNLAAVHESQGQYGSAEALLREALTMRQKLLGKEHSDVAYCLNNLATVLSDQRQYAAAEALHREALEMNRRLLGKEHPDIARNLVQLAYVLDQQDRSAAAESLYREALLMQQKLLGKEHPLVAASLNNLAVVLAKQGQYAAAEVLFREALAMKKKLRGTEYPTVAWSLHNLAAVLARQGRYSASDSLFLHAHAMRQKRLGKKYQFGPNGLNNEALVLIDQGRTPAALPLLLESARIREAELRATTGEVRVEALLGELRWEEDVVYGLLGDAKLGVEARELALRTALLRKGRSLESGAAANLMLHRNIRRPEVKQRFVAWQAARQALEALIYQGLGPFSPTEYQRQITELEQQSQELEGLLASDLPEIKELHPPDFDAIVAAVAAKLPKQAALVEVLWTEPYQARNPKQRFGAPRYFALLLFPDGHTVSVDLGEAAVVDGLCRELLGVLQHPGSQPAEAARALYDQILLPLRSKLGGVTDLYLSLDGTLNLVPFDALHDGTDYLLGRWHFHYLTSGRDLLRKPSKQAPGAALVLANPDFGLPDREPIESTPKRSEQSLYQRLKGLQPLPGTQAEAEALQELLRVQPLVQGAATEQAVRSAEAPRILHLATHGLFLDDVELPVSRELGRSMALLDRPRSRIVPTQETEKLPGRSLGMNRSALVLAGVLQGDRVKDTMQDGLLTAEEASSLNLDGTQLVVLSACQTGQGSLSAGQGVYGLRRAFLVAGAETLVTSLWRVSDAATGELMAQYYGKLFDKQQPRDRRGGMIEAMQELRQRPGRSHPYYWAPFLVIGQDGPLRR